LRLPRNDDDARSDPKYEEGSFGSTGCHSHNLLSQTGYYKNRIRIGDRLVFVQHKKVVFITPSLRGISKNKGGYVVVYWDSHWKSKEKRPLKLRFTMKLDLTHAKMINPSISDPARIASHLRTYSEPLEDPANFLRDFENFVGKQREIFKDTIFVERPCQTFCVRENCEECSRLMVQNMK